MKLAELLPEDRKSMRASRTSRSPALPSDSRKVEAGLSVLRHCRRQGRRRAFRQAGGGRRRGRGRGRAARRRTARRRRLRPGEERAPRAGAGGGEIFSAPARRPSPPSPAPAARPRSPPSRGRSGPRSGMQAASIGTIGVVSPQGEKSTARSPRPIRSNCIARSTSWRARASRIWRWKRPRTASTSTGSTACASRPAPSPICRATISIITRPSRPISPPSCGCSRPDRAGRHGGDRRRRLLCRAGGRRGARSAGSSS